MNYILNVSLSDVARGKHPHRDGDILIQIVDDKDFFPKSPYKFKKIHKFVFSDVTNPEDEAWEYRMSEKQAKEIAAILKKALKEKRNVIVHCVAGLCRSGAVAEVGIMMGFEDLGSTRMPNTYVKKLLMKELGMIPEYYE